MNWTGDEIRQLRYRLGWSQAEMARRLDLQLGTVMDWEAGRGALSEENRSVLLRILHQAESMAEKVHRRPIAEVMMKDRNLCQIHDMEVIDGLDETSTPATRTIQN